MYLGKKLSAKTKEELLSPPFVFRLQQYINITLAPMKKTYNVPKTQVVIKQRTGSTYTDGFKIVIGSETPVFSLPTIGVNNASLIVLGLVFHEMGHVLYTPFSAVNWALNAFSHHHFWPNDPDCDETKDVIDYISASPDNLKKMFSLYKMAENILEDGRIEAILLLKNGNRGDYAQGLRLLRKMHFRHILPNTSIELDKIDAMEEGKEKKREKFGLFFDLLLTLAKFGRFKNLDAKHYDHPMITDLNNLSEYIEEALDSVNAHDFYRNLNMIFVKSFNEYIKPYLDEMPATSEIEETLRKVSKIVSDDVKKTSKESASEIEKATEEAKEELEKLRVPSSGENSDEDEDDKEEESSPSSSGSKDKKGEESDDKEKEESESSSSNSKDTSEEGAAPLSIPRYESDSIWEGAGGGLDKLEDDYDESHGLDLEAIGKTPITFDSEEDEIKDTLELSKGLNYGSMNDNLSFGITRIDGPTITSSYSTYTKYIDAGKLAAKKIKPFIKLENKVFYEKQRFSGSKFKASRTANPNLRYFDKKTSTPKSPTLSVAILVDQSGSMGGRNIEIARATAIALFEMCSALEVPFAVFGHSADTKGYDVLIDNYCFFGENAEKDKYKLLKIHAGGNNRDGAALRYVSEVLAKQHTEKKLLFVISDGQPAAYGYGGTAAEKDIQSVIKEYEKLGVRYIAAAIDADKEQIKHIYDAKRFLNIDNVETLPIKLMAIVKKALGR